MILSIIIKGSTHLIARTKHNSCTRARTHTHTHNHVRSAGLTGKSVLQNVRGPICAEVRCAELEHCRRPCDLPHEDRWIDMTALCALFIPGQADMLDDTVLLFSFGGTGMREHD